MCSCEVFAMLPRPREILIPGKPRWSLLHFAPAFRRFPFVGGVKRRLPRLYPDDTTTSIGDRPDHEHNMTAARHWRGRPLHGRAARRLLSDVSSVISQRNRNHTCNVAPPKFDAAHKQRAGSHSSALGVSVIRR
jgi:hypothetical protein